MYAIRSYYAIEEFLSKRPNCWQVDGVESKTTLTINNKPDAVITSYSIHYTKLYDVDGEVKCTGKVPKKEDIKNWIAK